LQNETHLKRQSILNILLRSERLGDFKNNPQKFLDEVKNIIKHEMQLLIVEGIKYQKIGDQHFYAQELFQSEELIGYLNKNMREAQRSVYDHVVYDSQVENEFAKSLEEYEHVKVYAKLPGWFKIDTPLGSYNPDWAVLFELDGEERLYFVVESKATAFENMLRDAERAKTRCGEEHFKALGTNTHYFSGPKEALMDQVLARRKK
jgi:type III restriction enzyme